MMQFPLMSGRFMKGELDILDVMLCFDTVAM